MNSEAEKCHTLSFVLQITTPTNTIVLNAVDLKISSAIVKIGEKSLVATDIAFSPEQETVTLTLASKLPVGEGVLELSFTGNLNDKMKGFYRSKYYTPSGEERYGGVTQLYVLYCCICADKELKSQIYVHVSRFPPAVKQQMPAALSRAGTSQPSKPHSTLLWWYRRIEWLCRTCR